MSSTTPPNPPPAKKAAAAGPTPSPEQGHSSPGTGAPIHATSLAPTQTAAAPRLTDAELSARSTKHAAWVAAGAAILAAIIAFSGTWWSSAIAAKAASDSVIKQVSGETEKSRAEFLRGQRQVLYSKILTDEQQLMDAEATLDKALINMEKAGADDPGEYWEPYDVPGIKESESVVESSNRVFESDISSAEIIASKNVRDALGELSIAHERIADQLDERAHHRPRPQHKFYEFWELASVRDETLDGFRLAARKDMGSE